MKAKHLLIIGLVIAVAIAATAIGLMLGSRTANSTPCRLYLPQGTTYTSLCDTLNVHHLTSPTSHLAFSLIAHVGGLHRRTVCGSYLVEPQTHILDLARTIARRQQIPIRLTLSKFRTPDQLNHYLNTHLMSDSFAIPLDSFYLVRPNTYEFYWTTSPARFLDRMHREYDRFWDTPPAHATSPATRKELLAQRHPTLTPQQAIILASIIEEETNNTAEKPLMASVYLNRLSKGMLLQADPTVKYAVGDFTLRRILATHLSTPSPFNTYLNRGLPPAPICTPSASSLDAILNAPTTRYLYFCASPNFDGTHLFAATLAEHNRNAARFHAALNQRGIH